MLRFLVRRLVLGLVALLVASSVSFCFFASEYLPLRSTLSPLLVHHTVSMIQQLKDGFNLTVLMAEQNFQQALRIADRGYIIVHGEIVFEGRTADELWSNEMVRSLYLGA